MPVQPNFPKWWQEFINPTSPTKPAQPSKPTTKARYKQPGMGDVQRAGQPPKGSKPTQPSKPTTQTKPTSSPSSGSTPGAGGLHETKRDGDSLMIRYRNVNTGAWGGWVKVKAKKQGLPDRAPRVKEPRELLTHHIPTPVPPKSSIPTPVERPEDRSKNRNKSTS